VLILSSIESKLKTGLLAGFFILLQACVSAPQTELLLGQAPAIPVAYEIENVAFFPQKDFFCGPTTLAELLNYYGIDIEPDQVAPMLFIPGLEGSLQIEMASSIRQYGLLAYVDQGGVEQGNLLQLLSLISDGLPVIVLQNLGTTWYPVWHYALVIGYDLKREKVILHTGTTERRNAPMDLFESTWRKGQFWMLVAVPPERSSAYFNSFLYINAAQDLVRVGQKDAATKALETATSQWADYWLSYFLLGNYYLSEDPSLALYWYKKGLEFGAEVPSYLNNYAYALLFNGCEDQAVDSIRKALAIEPDNSTLLDSLADIQEQFNEQAKPIKQNHSCSS